MSMIGCFRSASDTEIADLLESPKRIYRVLYPDMDIPVSEPKQSLWSRLFGKPSQPQPQADNWQPESGNVEFDVDKAWHGIHFALCGHPEEGTGPLSFICCGGKQVGEEDVGYGPARAFTSSEVSEIVSALNDVEISGLRDSANASTFMENDIYPQIWEDNETESFEYVFSYLEDLRGFLQEVLSQGKGLLVYIS